MTSGCQAVHFGLEQLSRLGLSSKDLMPFDLSLRAVNDSNIKVFGAVFISLSGKDESGSIPNKRGDT